MKQAEFSLLNKGGVIDHVVIFRDRGGAERWSIFAYGAEGAVIPWSKDYIEPARSHERRAWSNLDTAYAFLRSLGWTKEVTVDG